VNRALVSLVCGALLVLFVGLGQARDPAIAAVLGVVFAAAAVAFQLYPRRGKRLVAVYFPMSYQIGGHTLYLPKNELVETDLSVEEAMRMILIGGVTSQSTPHSATQAST